MAPTIIVVTGASGCGKTTVGRMLARRRGVPFVEGDDLHPPSNIAKMSAGGALTDEDRAPWLQSIAARVRAAAKDGKGVVIACSALKYRYRQFLGAAGAQVWFLHLALDPEVARARIMGREGHFMLSSLLDSQLADLESLRPEEPGLVIDAASGTDTIVEAAQAALADFETRQRH
ncbi:gluconokinase [Streptomyces sp. NBC_01789]|uniref:gluconokinase n=1 Tax=Streptomyces sp. NBC_01789 TaxID=2975941 RepID=UPI002259D4CA|nr:gluconokinase [Streptomyces sp. NBC_01789]MCX4451294.1 gluconokinase [Streptomyces sp. NBC_01789]